MSPSAARYLAASCTGCLVLALASASPPTERLVFNTTASAPLGFYWRTGSAATVGDLVLVRPPPALAAWMARRGYLPLNVGLIKHLAAVEGQIICGHGDRLLIDGRRAADLRDRDRQGRRLSRLSGCQRLREGEVFLLNAQAPDSLDGRYFGPLSRTTIVGRLHPLWTWER
ncbi:S26 family signal peptidase [Caulobacter segnis]|uniref:Peptidase n=1 Tax=Caulobacter segnis TaxID=88688 RepID=A0A2W5V5U1_9CAUL|nr:S26 family signal peptidase [Caulobacter segnis]PZR34107.1 MAG: peptidase [Caulobacter segnis]